MTRYTSSSESLGRKVVIDLFKRSRSKLVLVVVISGCVVPFISWAMESGLIVNEVGASV